MCEWMNNHYHFFQKIRQRIQKKISMGRAEQSPTEWAEQSIGKGDRYLSFGVTQAISFLLSSSTRGCGKVFYCMDPVRSSWAVSWISMESLQMVQWQAQHYLLASLSSLHFSHLVNRVVNFPKPSAYSRGRRLLRQLSYFSIRCEYTIEMAYAVFQRDGKFYMMVLLKNIGVALKRRTFAIFGQGRIVFARFYRTYFKCFLEYQIVYRPRIKEIEKAFKY